MHDKRHLVVVGGGRVGRALIASLPESWRVTVIDKDPRCLELLPEGLGEDPLIPILGDASSRLVLEEAEVTATCSLAVVTHDDVVNREVARLARLELEVEDLVVLLDDVSGLDAIGVQLSEVVRRSTATATLVANRLSAAGVRGLPLGLGKGELLEVRILDGSPAVGRPLQEIGARNWLVAAVYRDGQLIVPHGQTALSGGDRVLVVGDPEVLQRVAPLLRGGEAVFPHQYGRHLGAFEEVVLDEARWVAEHTQARKVVKLDGALLSAATQVDPVGVAQAVDKAQVGAVVLAPIPYTALQRLGLTRSRRHTFVLQSRVPVLVARGRTPYKRVLVAVCKEDQIGAVAGTALDVARQCRAELSVLTVLPPRISLGDEARRPFEAIPQKVRHLGRLHGVEVQCLQDEGNPIERIRHHARDHDLVVIGHSDTRSHTVFSPDVSLFLMHDCPASLLVVPWKLAPA